MNNNFDKDNHEKNIRNYKAWLWFPASLLSIVALLTYDSNAIETIRTPPLPSSNWIGAVGDAFAHYGYSFLGFAIWSVPVMLISMGVGGVMERRVNRLRRITLHLIILFCLAALVQIAEARFFILEDWRRAINFAAPGGALGYIVMNLALVPLLSNFGASIVISLIAAVAIIALIGVGNISAFFVGLFRWALGRREPPPEPGTPEAEAYEEKQRQIEAALAAKEEARRQREEEKERIRQEKEQAKAEREAQKAAERAAREAEKAAERERKDAEKAAAEAERNAQLERIQTLRDAARREQLDQIAAARAAHGEDNKPTTTSFAPAPGNGAASGTHGTTATTATSDDCDTSINQSTNLPIQSVNRSIGQSVNSIEESKNRPIEQSDKGPYILPPLSLLAPLKASVADHSDIGATSQRLIDTLKLFGVDATMSYTVQGPVVTKYALMLAPGTRYTAVTNLQDNLKGALHAKSLRIEAPIPGEEAVGIEVPNLKPAGITFREIFESEAWKNSKAELPLLFGKRADGKELVADLASMPHMLVAGATGQGKSVCLNSLISGLLMTRTPEQLKLIMVDPKCVEFTPYSNIPHLLVPVITDNRKVVFSLHWAVAEMEKRLKMFARARVRNIYDFNHRKTLTQTDMFGNDQNVSSDMPRTVPYIVIIIDEAADLIGQCGKEVNPDIQRITQKARAAGIHLILATQRPDAKIITGAIKANIPGRVAFKTSSSVDSRTILDDTGAENLIGRGDMLFRGKDGQLIRAQGAWISDDEIAAVTGFIEEHSNLQFDEKFATKLGRVKEAAIDDPFASNEDDPDNQPKPEEAPAGPTQRELVKAAANADDFKKAVECIINTKRASTSHFQRQMGWGYNHAAKILDMLTEKGIVSPQQGMGPRQIVMDQDQLMAILNDGNGGAATDTIADGADAMPVDGAEPADQPVDDGTAIEDAIEDDNLTEDTL